VDGAGNAYITGSTSSSNFPTTPGAFQRSSGSRWNAFVARLNAGGSALVYSTYLGGSSYDFGSGIGLDGVGNAYVTGSTSSSNFPTTPGALQTTPGGGGYHDAFVTKLNAGGSALVYSTYLGGSNDDEASAIAVDGAGNAYVTGHTYSRDFPTTPGAFQRSNGGGPWDAFVARLNAGGSALVYSTYLGGNDRDEGFGIAVDAIGNAYVVGSTYSSNFPTTPGALQRTYGGGFSDAFVAKVPTCGGITTHLGLSNPTEVVVGSAFTISVSALDVYNNTDPSYRCIVHFATSGPMATLPADYAFTEVDAGRHTWTNGFILRSLGGIIITVTDTADPSVSGTRIVTVIPGLARTIEISAPTIVSAGVSGDITVTARDEFGNPATAYRGTVCFTSSDAVATLPDCYTFAAADPGSHPWPNGLTLRTAGRQTVTVADTVNTQLTVTFAVLVVPGPANHFILIDVPPVVPPGVPSAVTVVAMDQFDNTATGYRGTVHFTSSDGIARLPSDHQFYDFENGIHRWRPTDADAPILRTGGPQTITVTDTADERIAGSVTVVVSQAAAITLVVEAPAGVAAGAPFDVTVSARDPYGNLVTGYTGTVHFTSSDAAALLPVDYTFTPDDGGTHTFAGVTLFAAADQGLTVTDPDGGLAGSTTVRVDTGFILLGPNEPGAGRAGRPADSRNLRVAGPSPSLPRVQTGAGPPAPLEPAAATTLTGAVPPPSDVTALDRLYAANVGEGRRAIPARLSSESAEDWWDGGVWPFVLCRPTDDSSLA
jgi:hypothetical protein